MKQLCECPACGKQYRVSPERLASGFNCLSCGNRIRKSPRSERRNETRRPARRKNSGGMVAALVGIGAGFTMLAAIAWLLTGPDKPQGPELATKGDGLQYFPAPAPPPPVSDEAQAKLDEARRRADEATQRRQAELAERDRKRELDRKRASDAIAAEAMRRAQLVDKRARADIEQSQQLAEKPVRTQKKPGEQIIPGKAGYYGRDGAAIYVPKEFEVTDFTNDEDDFSIAWRQSSTGTTLKFDLRDDARIEDRSKPNIFTGRGSYSARGEAFVYTNGKEMQQTWNGRTWYMVASSDRSTLLLSLIHISEPTRPY